jgi:hypothetical protein
LPNLCSDGSSLRLSSPEHTSALIVASDPLVQASLSSATPRDCDTISVEHMLKLFETQTAMVSQARNNTLLHDKFCCSYVFFVIPLIPIHFGSYHPSFEQFLLQPFRLSAVCKGYSQVLIVCDVLSSLVICLFAIVLTDLLQQRRPGSSS